MFNCSLYHLSDVVAVYADPGLLLLTKVKLGLSVGVLAKLLILTLRLECLDNLVEVGLFSAR